MLTILQKEVSCEYTKNVFFLLALNDSKCYNITYITSKASERTMSCHMICQETLSSKPRKYNQNENKKRIPNQKYL